MTLHDWAAAQTEAETLTAEQAEVQAGLETMGEQWHSYQNELRGSMSGLNSELAQIAHLNIAIAADYEGLTAFVAGLDADAFTAECREVVQRYEMITVALEQIAVVIAQLEVQVRTLQEELSSWEAQIEQYELMWMSGGDNLFAEAQDRLYYLFSSAFGLDHDTATREQLLDMLETHDGMGAYEEIQAFFGVAYANFGEFENFKSEFCAMGALAELSQVGKIIIDLGDFCFDDPDAVIAN